MGSIITQRLIPRSTSCTNIDLDEVENCYADVTEQPKENVKAECNPNVRMVTITVTILATNDEAREDILDTVNDDNFVDNINDELAGTDNDIGSAGTGTVQTTGNINQYTFQVN